LAAGWQLAVGRGEFSGVAALCFVASNFNDLAAYRLAVSLAADVYSAVARWPAFDRSTIGMQVVRSADAVGANIAESTGRWTKTDKRRVLIIARGELLETEHWLRTARERGLLRSDATQRVAEVARALNGLIKQSVPN
jgi:four helix bundle protein